MSEWREDDFLERLAHSSPKRMGPGVCPEAEILCASVESEGTGPISAKLAQHIERCPACSDLRRRLVLFDQPESIGLDPDAMEAERCLDSWLKGFLASEARNPQVPSTASTPMAVLYPSAPRTRWFWKMQWALAAASMVMFTVGVVYIWRSIAARTPATEMARAARDQLAPTPLESPASPKTVPVDQARTQTVAPENSQGPKSFKVDSSAQKDTASASRPELAVAPGREPQTGAQTTPPVATEAPTVAENSSAPPSGTPVHPILPPERASLSQRTIQAAPRAEASIDCVTCSPIRISAGTRIWISLESTTVQNDGRFQFEGRLLLPVSVLNSVVLEKGTPVAGFGSTSGGQTSVQITEFVLDGSRYKLRKDSTAGVPQAAGTGKTVQFESGKIWEMWLDSAAVFEATGASGASPQH
jgi:hypothetical protein